MLSFLKIMNFKQIFYVLLAIMVVAFLVTYKLKIEKCKSELKQTKQELNISKIQTDTLRNALILQNKQIEILRLDEKNALNNYQKQVKLIKEKYKNTSKNVIIYQDGNCTQKLKMLETTIQEYVK